MLKALNSIDDNKAPVSDGFNVYFYKKAWPVLGKEVTNVILNFFETNDMYGSINRTLVTLIPKIKNPNTIK